MTFRVKAGLIYSNLQLCEGLAQFREGLAQTLTLIELGIEVAQWN